MILFRHKRLLHTGLLMLFLQLHLLQVWGQKVTMLEILNADLTAYDVKIGKDARKL